MPQKKLYRLNDGDRQIMERARVSRNPNWFTRFYLSSPDSGTYFRPVYPEIINKLRVPEFKEKAQKWAEDYDTLYGIWHQIDRPRYFGCTNPFIGQSKLEDWFPYRSEETLRESGYEHKYKVIDDPKYTEPVFHNPHGHQLLPWQLDMFNVKQFLKVCVGGYGCLAGTARIYDAELNQHIPVAELYKQKRAPVVLAWTGTRYVEQRATVPWIKGRAKLYRVRMASGREITVTADHAFLTERGYVPLARVSVSDSLLGCDGDLLPSSWERDPSMSRQDAPRYSRTTLNSQGDCPTCHHSNDEQPLAVQGSDQAFAPLPPDVPLHNHVHLHEGGWVHESNDTFRNLPCFLVEPHLSTNHSGYLPGHLADKLASFGYGENVVNVPSLVLLPVSATPQECVGYSDLVQPFAESGHDMAQTDCSCDWACQSPSTSYYTRNDSIISIEYVGEDEYYDLHVPIYENYLSEGLTSHNSGKTLGAAVELLIYAATLKRFRALVLAPEMKQANDIFFALQRMLDSTEYEKRFLLGAPLRYTGTSHPALLVGHSEIGKNTIEFLPISDNVEKIKTFTNVDYILVDQAEQINDLDTLIEVAGTRQRGQEGGREKLGIITLLANSAEGAIWEKYDQAEEQPDEVWAHSPSSAENIYLTVPDMLRYETHIGNDPDAIKMAIFGARPKGKGEIFTPTMLESFHAEWMDGRTDAEIVKIPKAGVVKWVLPPVEGRSYLVTADSGQENPPKRNSAVIGIWDITKFPEEPASLWGFDWVISNGSNEVWLNKFSMYMLTYQTTLGAWDATGQGNAYNNPKTGLTALGAVPIQFGGALKMQYIGLAQLMMSQGKLRAPRIEGLFGQLSRYILPEKNGTAQDCVAMVLVTAGWLKSLFFAAQMKRLEPSDERTLAALDRWNRPDEGDRYDAGYDNELMA